MKKIDITEGVTMQRIESGITCFHNTSAGRLKLNGNIWFYENDKISAGRLSEPQTIESPAGTLKVKGKIKFYESGKTSDCRLSESQVIDTPVGNLELYGDIWFHKNGRIKVICLNDKLKIDREVFMKETKIGWDEEGDFTGKMAYDVVLDDFVPEK